VGQVVVWVWNRTEQNCRSKPGPLAGSPSPLLTLVKPAQLQRSGFSYGKTQCNGSVPVRTLTWNHSSGLEPLLTLSPNLLQAAYTDVRNWEELIDFINKHGCPKEPYTLTFRFKCTLENDELEEEFVGLYTNGQMVTDPIYGQISYNCCILNSFKLQLGHDSKTFLPEIQRVTRKEIAEYIIRPAKVIPTSCVMG
jgi:hypothetical protein